MPERRARLTPMSSISVRRARLYAASASDCLPAVEAEHQLLPEALAQGMFDDQGLQFGNQCDVRPERQFGVVAQLDGRQTQGVEAATLAHSSTSSKPSYARPRHRLQGGPQVCRVAGAAGGAIDERFEATGIDPRDVGVEEVAARRRDDEATLPGRPSRFEAAAQPRPRGRARCARRSPEASPATARRRVRRRSPAVRRGEQLGKHGPFPAHRHRDRPVRRGDHQRPEHAKGEPVGPIRHFPLPGRVDRPPRYSSCHRADETSRLLHSGCASPARGRATETQQAPRIVAWTFGEGSQS